ncbi:MAG: amidase [Paracoccaceae bacterium]|jgi:amidase
MPNSPKFTGPDICRLEAHTVVAMLKKGDVSPAELLEATFTRLAQVEPVINAMPTTCRERAENALEMLDSADKDHPGYLAGLPLGIKDLDRVKGVRTTFGTKAKADYVPGYSEQFVETLEERGGIVVGKTNTPELGAGGNTFNEVLGTTRNPWNTTMNAAGSSGGATASLAAGETWLSQGSDHGGSLRTPAAFCGVVGLRPSPGRVAVTLPKVPSAGFFIEGVHGPMARSVRDCALFLDAMSGFTPGNPISFPAPEIPFQQSAMRADGNVRIAFAPDLDGFGPVEKEIDDQMRLALTKVEAGGGIVVEDCPALPNLEKTYHALRGFGFLTSILREPETTTKHFKATLNENIKFGQSLTLEDLANANLDRTLLFANMESFLGDFDVLACPTVGCMPRPVEQEWVTEINGQKMNGYMDWLRFAFLATTTGLPAISVPIGICPSGMPIGLQLIGPPRGEAKLLAVARAVEVAVGGPLGPIDPVVTHKLENGKTT